jgi:hypothetical protein
MRSSREFAQHRGCFLASLRLAQRFVAKQNQCVGSQKPPVRKLFRDGFNLPERHINRKSFRVVNSLRAKFRQFPLGKPQTGRRFA